MNLLHVTPSNSSGRGLRWHIDVVCLQLHDTHGLDIQSRIEATADFLGLQSRPTECRSEWPLRPLRTFLFNRMHWSTSRASS